ncbi:MAG TPA: hypothetical protein VJB59_04100 [Bdellovibrionota bacterium]|nr:hypothetical protein [Bdellovibrionota bacterium]
MTNQVAVAMLIEVLMIGVTSLLLIQPVGIFGIGPSRIKAVSTWGGMVMLCVTFCWSVIFGCVLFLNSMTLKI